MKHVLLVTNGIVHPPFTARRILHNFLADMNGYSFEHTNSLEKLPDNLEQYSAFVLYIHHKNISERALAVLDEYVSKGGGLLGIHTATASFKNQKGYHKILGGRFVEHGKVEPFDVTPSANSEIFSEIPTFTVTDELYLHEFYGEITVHFTTNYKDQDIPTVWTKTHGVGRVCYGVPGHTTRTMRNQTYQKILKRGLQWVCGE